MYKIYMKHAIASLVFYSKQFTVKRLHNVIMLVLGYIYFYAYLMMIK